MATVRSSVEVSITIKLSEIEASCLHSILIQMPQTEVAERVAFRDQLAKDLRIALEDAVVSG